MIRKLIIVALSSSTALVVIAWVASYISPTNLKYLYPDGSTYSLHSNNGKFEVARWYPVAPTTKPRPEVRWVFARFMYVSALFRSDYGNGPPAYCAQGVAVPFWFLFASTAAFPTLAFIRSPLRRYHRRRNGWCITCGYNLTGNTSGVCPECGTTI